MLMIHRGKEIIAFIAKNVFKVSSNHPRSNQHLKDKHSWRAKHNPEQLLDLRGLHSEDILNQRQKSYSPMHSKQYSHFSAYGLSSLLLPNSVAKKIGKLIAHPKSSIASDSVYLPKIYQDSVPIYDSIDKASTYLVINKLVYYVLPLNILLFTPEPFLSLLTYSLFYYVYSKTNWSTVKNLVIKVQLLPNTEEIVYQKLTRWGTLTTKKAKISDLEHTTFDDIFGEESYKQRALRGLYNRQVCFKVKSSGDLLFFDKNGIWNEEGIKHKLLI